MHPFLVWLLSSSHETPSTIKLANFALETRHLFDEKPSSGLAEMLGSAKALAGPSGPAYTATAWNEYQLWCTRVLLQRSGK